MLGMFLLACTMLWISMSGQENSKSNPSFLRNARQLEKGVAHRRLQDTAAVDVGLYLAVQYLDESVAVALETKDPSNELVSHFCKSVNYQVRVVICKEGEKRYSSLLWLPSESSVPNVLHIVD
jgi:hypothetical protein